jgi:hypothetical protein
MMLRGLSPCQLAQLALPRPLLVPSRMYRDPNPARCVMCPADTGASVGAMLGIGAALAAVAFLIFRIRSILPVGLIKLGVSMLQIIASGSTSYAIPWYVTVCIARMCEGCGPEHPQHSRLFTPRRAADSEGYQSAVYLLTRTA